MKQLLIDFIKKTEMIFLSFLRGTIKRIIPEQIWIKTATTYNYNKYRLFGRPLLLEETSKARRRRERDEFFIKYCQGFGIDIGYGGDLVVDNAFGWDQEHGDAQYMESVKDKTYDFVYTSHILEHLISPEEALKNWYRILKKGGFLIIFIPHRDLYEKKLHLPSRFNEDHKHFFLLDQYDPPDTIGIVPLIQNVLPSAEIIYAKICNDGFLSEGNEIHSKGEYSIEVVCRK